MPLANAIIRQSFIAAIVAVVIEKALLHLGGFRVGMDIAQGIQSPSLIRIRKPRAVIALFSEVPTAIEHPVKTHGRIPVQPVHDFGQVPTGNGHGCS